jgi:hypothetical protein
MVVTEIDTQTKELSEFCSVLWCERAIVECVLFRLTAQQLLLKAGYTQWLAAASNDVANAMDELRETEVLRSADADALARVLGPATGATLGELAEAAPEPWASMLLEHRDALRELTAGIEVLSEQNRELLVAGAQAAHAALISPTDSIDLGLPEGFSWALPRIEERV